MGHDGSQQYLFIDNKRVYLFGASLKDLGKNTFFFTQEDFTLDEVLKESQKIQSEKESRALQDDNVPRLFCL